MGDEFPMALNISSETFDAYSRDEKLARIEIGTLICMFLTNVVGNVLVLLTLYAKKCQRGKKTLSRMYFFIFHLCIADLINAFFNILPQLIWDITYRFKGGSTLCKAVKYGQILGPYLSSYILMARALDRYRAICYPLTYQSWSFKRSRIFVVYAWCISLLFSIPQVFIFSFQEVAPGIYDCWATFSNSWGERTYVVWYSLSIFMVPLAGLIFTYTFICRVIWRNAHTELGKQGQLISRAKINTVKQTAAVIAVYIICSLPFIVAELWAVWDPTAFDKVWLGPLFTILVLLSSLNSCANPWIFILFDRDILLTLKFILRGKILPVNHCFKLSTGDCSYTASYTRRRVPRLNLRKTFTLNKRKSDTHFVLKKRGVNVDENGVTTTTEITLTIVP